MRYVADNILDDEREIVLHDLLMDATRVLSNNLFFSATEDCSEDEKQNLINSSYTVIAICEAIAAKGTIDQREEAIKEVRKAFGEDNQSKQTKVENVNLSDILRLLIEV